MENNYLVLANCKMNATGIGLNDQITMEACRNGMFKVTQGRVGVKVGIHKPKTWELPISEWNLFLAKKRNMGYRVVATERLVEGKKEVNKAKYNFDNIDSNAVNFMKMLLNYSAQFIEEQYTIKLPGVTLNMLNEAESILNDLADNYKRMSVATFNKKLQLLYTVLPRRIDNLYREMVTFESEMPERIVREQEIFDVMRTMKNNENKLIKGETPSILDVFGLTFRTVNENEEKYLKGKMGVSAKRFVTAFKVENKKTKTAFDNYIMREGLSNEKGKDCYSLFHGSRAANWWSIITNGLTVNPHGVQITGKMFGNGTYFATDADKSLGYVDCSGRWAGGNEQYGFLGVFRVATGDSSKRYNPTKSDHILNFTDLRRRNNRAYSTWARATDVGLRKDEIIVYTDSQSTIEYLIVTK